MTFAVTELQEESARFQSVSVFLLDENDQVVASIEAAVFRSVHLIKPFMAERTFREEHIAVDAVVLPSSRPRARDHAGRGLRRCRTDPRARQGVLDLARA